MLPRHTLEIYQENELTHNLLEKAQPQSSQLTEPHWTDPVLTSGIGMSKLISKRRRRKKKSEGRD